MQEPKNETAVCLGALRFLAERRGEVLTVTDQPDQRDRRRPAVEMVAQSAAERFVIEHTRVESFPLQISDGKQFFVLMDPLERALPPLLPPGTYELIIVVGSAGSVPRNQLDAVRAAIGAWVVTTATRVQLGPDDDDVDKEKPWSITETPPAVPFEVTLQRRPPDTPTQVFAARFSPADLETERRTRIRVAVARKCPKLLEAKQQHGATSVLILESDDIALANRHVTSEAIIDALRDRTDIPDVVLLVETDRGVQWELWLVKDGHIMYPAIEEPGPYTIE